MARSRTGVTLPRFRRLAWRGVSERPTRSVLTTCGVALGVAFFLGVTVSNATVDRGVAAYLDRFFGRTDVDISALGSGTVPPGTVDRVRRLPGVAQADELAYAQDGLHVVAMIQAGSVAASHIKPVGNFHPHFPFQMGAVVPLLGTNIGRSSILGLYLLSGRLPRTGEVLVTRNMADDLGLSAGSAVTAGPRRIAVSGVVDRVRYNDYAVVASLETARMFVGSIPVNEIDVRLDPSVSPAVWTDEQRAELAPLDVSNRNLLGGDLRRNVTQNTRALGGLALVALFVGMFLVYSTFTSSVAERRAQVATMRALGASRRQLATMVAAEAGTLGGIGSLVGVPVGVGVGAGLAYLSAHANRVQLHGIAISPGALVVGLLVGTATSLVAAAMPAWQAARAPVVEGFQQPPEARGISRIAWVGLASIALGLALIGFSVSSVLLLVGVVLAAPSLLGPLARLAGRVGGLARRRAAGQIGVAHLVGQRSRSGLTLGLLVVVLASVLGTNTTLAMAKAAVDRQLAAQFGADLEVFGAPSAAAVRAVPGVAAVTPLGEDGLAARMVDHPHDDVALTTIDPGSFFSRAGFVWAHGNDDSARRALERGGAVLVPNGLAARLHIGLGSVLRLRTIAGPRPFVVVGRFEALTNPALVIGESDGPAFGITKPSELDVWGAPGIRLDALRSAISRTLRTGVGTMPMAQLRASARSGTARLLRLFSAVLAAAVLIGMLGLANTLAVSVFGRVREIGVLRAVGASRRTVGMTVVVEGAVLCVVALVLAVPLGTLLGFLVGRGVGTQLGFHTPVIIAWSALPVLAVLAALVATVGSVWPAWRAARMDPVGALRFD